MIGITALLAGLKSKLLSTAGIFIGCLVVLIGVFLWSNSDLIMTKFGFETRSNLKASVVQLTSELQKAESVNRDLMKELERIEKYNKEVLITLESTVKEKDRLKDIVQETTTIRKTKNKDTIIYLDRTTKVNNGVVEISQAPLDSASENNIAAIHDAYDKLINQKES